LHRDSSESESLFLYRSWSSFLWWLGLSEKIRLALKKQARQRIKEAKDTMKRMESEAADALAEFDSKKVEKKFEYSMASWRRGSKVHNEYLGSCKNRIGKPSWRRPGGSRLRIWGKEEY
jgi:hypothetical protein